MEWIKVVENETPKELETILIYDEISDLSISIGHYDKKGFNDWVEDTYVKCTHYAYIKPPKE